MSNFRTFCITYPYHGTKRNVYVKAMDEEDAEYIQQQIANEGRVDGELVETIILSPTGETQRIVEPFSDTEEESSH